MLRLPRLGLFLNLHPDPHIWDRSDLPNIHLGP